ncbi:MAG: decaprenyl-phosphate phosphoribosyltransferase, partial [Deltaproteobacteria bacterium]|nr:decaprenyl-phosphate phosphoribosyltransferase [Deltaproteobacteria bacterium]
MKTEVRTLHNTAAVLDALHHLLLATRPRDWIKNFFLFAPLFFSQNALNPALVLKSTLAFALFCIAASGVYLINDISDREEDRTHPEKRNRPIAAGTLPVPMAGIAAGLLLVIAVGGAFLLEFRLGFVTLSYVILVVTYSKWLKHLVIVDVFAIAAGFVLRVAAGAVVIDVVMSNWLVICTMLLALFLGLSKRRYELVTLSGDGKLHRQVLAEYNPLFLDMMIGIVTSAIVVSYALYTVSQETVQRFHTDRLLFTLPFVLYGIFRYLYLVYQKNSGGDPSRTLISDGPLLVD